MTVTFGTKAETLERLAPLLTTARVLPQFRFTVLEWQRDRSVIMDRLQNGGWLDQPVMVRSSAVREDGTHESFAGQFLSIPHVQAAHDVASAIDRVIDSYSHAQNHDQVFLQPYLTNIALHGVAFGLDPVSGGPYIVINYQRGTQSGAITEGVACDDELFYWRKNSPDSLDPSLRAVVMLMTELEHLFETAALDVEFAEDAETLFLLQVRPLTTAKPNPTDTNHEIARLKVYLAKRATTFPQVLGQGIVWGVMPDWNPAEMIGLRPRPLALGLYRECITDQIWAEQRRRYGYRDVTGVPLMENLGGQAMIDVRASFTSFVPAAVPDELAEKIVVFSLMRLHDLPELHDKVETDLLFHCWTFDLAARLNAVRADANLTVNEVDDLYRTLLDLTRDCLNPQSGPWATDRQKMVTFDSWLTHRSQTRDPITPRHLQSLLQCCRDDAALPFAGLARVGFIAVCLIDSLVRIGVWSKDDRERFYRSRRTVLTQLHSDRQTLSTSEFLSRYGHLRPGTYDLLVPRYDEAPEKYLSGTSAEPDLDAPAHGLTEKQVRELDALLQQAGFETDADAFLRILGEAIEWREYGKFVYSRGISELLRELGEYAAMIGFTLDDCSYADQSLWDKTVIDDEFPARLRDAIMAGRATMDASQGLALPPLLQSLDQLYAFRFPRCLPNFITRNIGYGPVLEVEPHHSPSDLHGMIVMLPSADPGYDWIFSTGIAGFITKFGGANSHMAIRSREWNLPSAIGVGEVRYRRLVQARAIRIDCEHQLLVTIP